MLFNISISALFPEGTGFPIITLRDVTRYSLKGIPKRSSESYSFRRFFRSFYLI